MNDTYPLRLQTIFTARSKEFTLAIDSLELPPQSLTCIVGPNGSGKTTLIESIIGLLPPQKGEVYINGEKVVNNLRRIKAKIGYIPDDESWFVKELSAREYFEVLVSVYRDAGTNSPMQSAISRLARELHFTQFETPLEYLSHGNKKKVQIIAGLMHEPQLIIIDELRNGLDPLAIIAAEKLLNQRVLEGATILAATHDLWWAERVADTIGILINGRLSFYGLTEDIVKNHGSLEALFIKMTQK